MVKTSRELLWKRHIDHIHAYEKDTTPETEPAQQEEFHSFARQLATDPADPVTVGGTPEAVHAAGSETVSSHRYPLRDRSV